MTSMVRYLFPTLALFLAFQTRLDATILSAGGAAVLIPFPPDAGCALPALESNTTIWAWEEQHCFDFTATVPVDIDGTPGTYNSPATLTGGTLSPMFLDSHFIHFDQLGPGVTTLTGSLVFAEPIVGVQVLAPSLMLEILSSPRGTLYPTGASRRGLDWDPGFTEVITISPDRLRIDFTLITSNVKDQVRVFTEGHGFFVRGDANADGQVDLSDSVYILVYEFGGGPAPPCADAADANDDGSLDISDPIYLLNWLFLSGPAPPDPTPVDASGVPSGTYDPVLSCGPDPTPDSLPPCPCGSFGPCP